MGNISPMFVFPMAVIDIVLMPHSIKMGNWGFQLLTGKEIKQHQLGLRFPSWDIEKILKKYWWPKVNYTTNEISC